MVVNKSVYIRDLREPEDGPRIVVADNLSLTEARTIQNRFMRLKWTERRPDVYTIDHLALCVGEASSKRKPAAPIQEAKTTLQTTNEALKLVEGNLRGALQLHEEGADIPAVVEKLIDSSLEIVQGLLGRPEGASQEVPADLQNRIINAVEKVRSVTTATGNASWDYSRGYGNAKRDVLLELVHVFSGDDLKGGETSG